MTGLPLADELLVHLATPDRRTAAQHCAALVGGGMTLDHLVDQGLAPAMTQVGALWESAVWTVVDEHMATAVAEASLSAAAAERSSPRTLGEAVVACVEGDWHSLPARMVAEVLDGHGWSVRFLGASQPTSMLIEHLTRRPRSAVLLSCAVPMALPALLEAVYEIHRLDLPVYVGGRALGANPSRALSLHADGWAPNAAGAAALLARPAVPMPEREAPHRLTAYRSHQLLLTGWVADAMDTLDELMPAARSFTGEARERTRLDLHHLLDTACIALMLDDPTLMQEQCDWLTEVLNARGVPLPVLAHGLRALRRTEPPGEHDPAIAAVLRGAEHHVAASPPAPNRLGSGAAPS